MIGRDELDRLERERNELAETALLRLGTIRDLERDRDATLAACRERDDRLALVQDWVRDPAVDRVDLLHDAVAGWTRYEQKGGMVADADEASA